MKAHNFLKLRWVASALSTIILVLLLAYFILLGVEEYSYGDISGGAIVFSLFALGLIWLNVKSFWSYDKDFHKTLSIANTFVAGLGAFLSIFAYALTSDPGADSFLVYSLLLLAATFALNIAVIFVLFFTKTR